MTHSGNRGRKLAEVRDSYIERDTTFRQVWEDSAVKRNIAVGLVRLRRQAGLNQRQLAKRAGWDPAFVSRLESVPGKGDISLPDLRTLITYVKACGSETGFIFSHKQADGVHISEIVALSGDRDYAATLESLEGQDLEMADDAAAEEPAAASRSLATEA